MAPSSDRSATRPVCRNEGWNRNAGHKVCLPTSTTVGQGGPTISVLETVVFKAGTETRVSVHSAACSMRIRGSREHYRKFQRAPGIRYRRHRAIITVSGAETRLYPSSLPHVLSVEIKDVGVGVAVRLVCVSVGVPVGRSVHVIMVEGFRNVTSYAYFGAR